MDEKARSEMIESAEPLARRFEVAYARAKELGQRRQIAKLDALARLSMDEMVPLLRGLAAELQRVRVDASAARAELARRDHPANQMRRLGMPTYLGELIGLDESDFF